MIAESVIPSTKDNSTIDIVVKGTSLESNKTVSSISVLIMVWHSSAHPDRVSKVGEELSTPPREKSSQSSKNSSNVTSNSTGALAAMLPPSAAASERDFQTHEGFVLPSPTIPRRRTGGAPNQHHVPQTHSDNPSKTTNSRISVASPHSSSTKEIPATGNPPINNRSSSNNSSRKSRSHTTTSTIIEKDEIQIRGTSLPSPQSQSHRNRRQQHKLVVRTSNDSESAVIGANTASSSSVNNATSGSMSVNSDGQGVIYESFRDIHTAASSTLTTLRDSFRQMDTKDGLAKHSRSIDNLEDDDELEDDAKFSKWQSRPPPSPMKASSNAHATTTVAPLPTILNSAHTHNNSNTKHDTSTHSQSHAYGRKHRTATCVPSDEENTPDLLDDDEEDESWSQPPTPNVSNLIRNKSPSNEKPIPSSTPRASNNGNTISSNTSTNAAENANCVLKAKTTLLEDLAWPFFACGTSEDAVSNKTETYVAPQMTNMKDSFVAMTTNEDLQKAADNIWNFANGDDDMTVGTMDTVQEDDINQLRRLGSWNTQQTYDTANSSVTGDLPMSRTNEILDDEGTPINPILLQKTQERHQKNKKKKLVKFEYPPISSLRQYPRSDPRDLPSLFFTERELDEIEHDRLSTMCTDDVEIVAVASKGLDEDSNRGGGSISSKNSANLPPTPRRNGTPVRNRGADPKGRSLSQDGSSLSTRDSLPHGRSSSSSKGGGDNPLRTPRVGGSDASERRLVRGVQIYLRERSTGQQ